MTKSRAVVGVKDMSAHSLAPRGQQTPPPSEPEGLTDEQFSAAVAPTPSSCSASFLPAVGGGG